jgi:hypothetical protein
MDAAKLSATQVVGLPRFGRGRDRAHRQEFAPFGHNVKATGATITQALL